MSNTPRVAPQAVLDGPLPPCKGYQQLNSDALASSTGLTVPAGSTIAFIQAEGAPVRYRADGVAPTNSVGMLIDTGGEVLYVASEDALKALRFIRTTAGAILNCSYY
jgi:hypothetical protein